jgi:PAS domain S-box-containing protein
VNTQERIRRNTVLRLGVIALAYFVATKIGLMFVAQPEGLASVWLASGVTLAALLLSAQHEWRAILATIFLVNTLSNLSSGNSLAVSVGFALAHTAEPALGGWLMVRLLGERITFAHLAEVLGLFGIATLANGLTALLGAAVPALGFGASYWDVWRVWWLADGLGILLVTPFIVTWMRNDPPIQKISLARVMEAIVVLALLTATAWIVFGVRYADLLIVPRPYMLFPLLVWAALRSSQRGATTMQLPLAAIALGSTLLGMGEFPLGGQTRTDRLLLVQMFLSAASLAGLIPAAMFAERKRAEEALEREHALVCTLIDNVPDRIYVKDRASRFLLNNLAHLQALGAKSQDEVIGKTDLDLRPKEIAEQYWVDDQRVLESGEPLLDLEEPTILPNGKQGWLLTTKVPLRDQQGNISGLVGISRDITERKRVENALRESEQRYRHLFAEMLSGFALHEIVCDDQGVPVNYRFLEVNPAFERLTGLQRDDILGKTALDVLPTLESFWINMYGRVALTGEPVRFEQYLQPLHKYYEVSAFCPRRGQFAITFQDVTERKQRERELEAVATVSAALRGAQTRAEMLPIILEQTSNLLHAQVVAIGFRDRMTGETVVEQANGLWANAIGRRIPPGAGVSGYVYRTGKPYVTDNLPDDTLYCTRA